MSKAWASRSNRPPPGRCLQPYPGGEGTRRYYQDAAIRAVMEKIAQCEIAKQPKRALLSLATGAGKTFIAVNLLKRISDAGQLTRALFVCDRDELRTQALKAFQNVFGSDAAEVYRKPDGTNNAKNARIHIATYQTLGVENENGDATFLTTYYPENYFTHIVIDECHRSAWGKWSQVLTRNRNAVQIGLTATPASSKCKEETRRGQAGRRNHRQQPRLLRRTGLRVRHRPGHRGRLPRRLRNPEGPGQPRRHRHHQRRDHRPQPRGRHHRPAHHRRAD